MQKLLTIELGLRLHSGSLAALITKRVTTLFPECSEDILSVDWDNLFSMMGSLGMHTAMCVFKTYVNSWTTSRRFHEDVQLPCLFGCPGEQDDLRHYMRCNRLWRAIRVHTSVSQDLSAIRRLALLEPSPARLKLVAVAFSVYHAVKHSELALALHTIRTKEFSGLATCVRSLAGVSARALGLSR